ncbi:cytochrome P450 [Cladochytrium replicatum]|nr:cytochrome P450 [Cladochytrium replicatum]
MLIQLFGTLIAIAVVGCTAAYVRWRKRPIACYPLHPSNKIQRMLYPIVGHIPRFIQTRPTLHDFFADLYNDSPDTEALLMPFTEPVHFIKTPENLEYVLKTKFESFEKGTRFRTVMASLLGKGIFNSDGDAWKYQRKTASHIFNTKNFREFVSVVIRKEVDALCGVLTNVAESGEVVDMQDLFFRLTLDSFAKLAFSVDLDSVTANKPIKFALKFDRAQLSLLNRLNWPLWKITETDDIRADFTYVREFGRDLVRKRREDIKNDVKFSSGDILQQFLAHAEEHGENLSDEQLVDHVLNFMIAGRDTTAQALSWIIYNLSKSPEATQKLVEEIDRVGPISDMSYEEMTNRFPYANAIFMETLRLYPSVPANFKTAVVDEVLPDGTIIPKGASVAWVTYAMGRTRRIWGDDAAVFRPERWFEFTSPPSDFVFPAFQAGPRLCLGKRLATIEAIYVLVSIFQQFSVKVENINEVRYAPSITLPMSVPIMCSARMR